MKMILDGIRVIDWTIFQQGPIASQLLGDLGADVIKVEQRGVGDPARAMMRVAGASLGAKEIGRNSYFEAGNRNKRAIAVDLNKPQGKEIIDRLVEKSDVFVQNYRKGVAERLGLDYKTLSKHNPRLIYAHASGWGPKGPDRDDPSADYTGLARSSFMFLPGEPASPPLGTQGGVGDQAGGIMTAFGVIAALLHRERTNEGQEIEASLLGSSIFLLGHPVTMNTISHITNFRISRTRAQNPLWNHYACSDGKWIALANLQPDKFWPNVTRALGMAELEKNPRFDSMENRAKNCEELISILDKVFASKPRNEWLKILKRNNVIYTLVNELDDLKEDPQILENHYITTFEHPIWGHTKTIGFPVTFEKTPMSIRREAPEFNQHTEEVLTSLLDYSWEDIAKLQDAEVI